MLKYLKTSIRDKIAQDAVISVFNGRKKEKFTRIFMLLFAKINITRFKIYILRDKILKSRIILRVN